MATQPPQPIIHSYTEINPGKFASVKHYELNQVVNGTPVFTETINISIDRKFAKSNPVCWLKIREGKKWKAPAVTGLFKTNFPGIFKGDSQHKNNLIIIKFSNDASQVKIYYFKDFYTRDLKALIGSTIS
jgi:hypothetical protein